MITMDKLLRFTSEAEATVYFYLPHAAKIGFTADCDTAYRLCDFEGSQLSSGYDKSASFALIGDGNFRLTFIPKGSSAEIGIFFDEDVIPYIMPGVGVLWEHGGVFPLLLSKNREHRLWVLSSPEDKSKACAVIKGVDHGEDVRLFARGEEYFGDWYPKLNRPWFWHTAELPTSEAVKAELGKPGSDVRFTVYNRAVTALSEPKCELPFGKLIPTVTDEDQNETDARLEIFSDSERIFLCDRLSEDTEPLFLPYGRYRVKASKGLFYGEDEIIADVGALPCEIKLTVPRTVSVPKGWVRGELHTHSSLEDATLFPSQVMRAARANGLGFCFMTDKDVSLISKFGLHDCDKSGVFAAFPGQEIMCHELHTNLLNPSHTIENPEAEDLAAMNFDIEEKIAGWLAEYRDMKKERPCLIMHNHPTHRAEVAKRGQPYFRSWWVSDMFGEDYHLVENCGFEGWFDRLNRGKKIYAAWTGDGHDCTLMYPGMEGICVYTGGELTEKAVIDALENGRFFSCRKPGAFTELVKLTGRTVRLTVKAALPIERAEIVENGRVTASFEGGTEIEAEHEIALGTRWCIARVKLSGGDLDEKRHSFTPFMESGYAAFTNPIFWEENRK